MHGNMVLMREIPVKYEEKKKEREDNKEKEEGGKEQLEEEFLLKCIFSQ